MFLEHVDVAHHHRPFGDNPHRSTGIAEYFDLDPTVVRVAYVLISVVSVAFPGILAYIILMFVMPPPDSAVTPAG